jgi:hypothetical protein
MKSFPALCLMLALMALCGCRTGDEAQSNGAASRTTPWRGLHLMVSSDENTDALVQQLPKLSADGVNVIIAEVDYNFDFQSHPELRPSRYITKAGAERLATAAREQGIRLIPEINCLGHQSWRSNTLPLLAKYPEFDETPGHFPGNQDLYCRSWCPQNPEVNRVVFALVDEVIDAFHADAFHVGMDEVFIMASEYCPRCHGRDPAKMFAKAVNDFHRHLVAERKVEMLMWGDRLLDAKAEGYSRWEAATNGTPPAIDLIPKDIIICDWHYEKRADYPSVPVLLNKGFRVWPSGWQPLAGAEAFSAFSRQQQNARVIGYLCTTWGKVKIGEMADWPPLVEPLRDWR